MHSISPRLLRISALSAIAFLGLVGRIDTAQAQAQDTLNVTPTAYTFTAPLGGGTQTATIQVTSSAAPLSYTLTYTSASNWFVASVTNGGNTGTTPNSVSINVNPGQLATGNYTGTITLTPTGAGTTPVNIPMTLIVGTSTSIIASPSSLSFSATVGSTAVTPQQQLSVNSGTSGINFTASVAYIPNNVSNWLNLNATFGVTLTSLAVSANPTGLAAGTYTATITISNGQGSFQPVNVTLTIAAIPTISSNLTSIPFFYQIGQSQTLPSSYITISTVSTSPIIFTASYSTTNCPGFLGISPNGTVSTSSGSPATIQVYVSGLASYTQPITCTGAVTITSPTTSNTSITIPVTLTVSNSPLLQVTPSAATFTYSLGGATPANQNLTITSTTSGLSFTTASSQPWLAVTPSGITTANSQISLSLVPSVLATLIPNTYQATITVTAPGAANSPLTIPVTLTVSANSMLTFSPPAASFVYEIGQLSPLNTQSIVVGTTGGQIPFNATVTPSGTTTGTFVTVTPNAGVAPATVLLTAVPTSLAPGTYTNTVNIITTNASQTQTGQTIAVTLTVSPAGQPQLTASPQALTFSYAQGQNTLVTPQTISLTSTDQTTQLAISNVIPNSSWVITNFTPGSNLLTPQNLQVSVNPAFLTPSVTPYTANLTVTGTTSTGATSTATVQVVFNYTSNTTLTATPTTLSFAQAVGGGAPANQTINIGASGTTGATLPFSATASTVSGGGWLTVTPASGTAPGTVTIGVTTVAATLTPGTYSASVVIYGMGAANANGTLTIPVTLVVTSAPMLTASPVGLTFTGAVAGANPATQTIQVTVPSGSSAVTFTPTVATTSGGNWLSVSPSVATTTPATLTITANLSGLATGTYSGAISLTPVGGGAATLVQVSFTVGAQVTPGFTQIINAASGVTGSIAPGELVSIFGTGIGPAAPAGIALTAQGNVATSVGGVSVSFNGIPAPITYVSATQINCVVPFEVATASTAQVQIAYNGLTSTSTQVSVISALPGIFTQNSSGSGIGAILTQSGTIVSATNAATRGSTIVIYATGGGLTTPSSITGGVAGSTLLRTTANVSVTIGGVAATVAYAGSAPGFVEGVLQINAVVPTTISAGTQAIQVTVGSNTSQGSVTVPVQ